MLAKDLAALGEIDVTLVTPSGAAPSFEARLGGRVRVRTLPQRRIREPANRLLAGELGDLLDELDVDVVHYQVGGDPWLARAVQRSCRRGNRSRSLVCTIHEVRDRWRDEDRWWSVIGRRIALAASAHVIVLTEATRTLLQRQANRLPPLSIIPHGETGSWFASPDAATAEELRPPHFLFFGRIRPYKGVDLLIEAGRPVGVAHDDFRLVIAGAGATEGELFPEGTPPWIELRLGHIEDHEVGALFDRVRAVVLPYRNASQSGIAANALGLGCPVVTFDIGGLAEAVRNGENGLVVPRGSVPALTHALEQLSTDDDQARALRVGAARSAGLLAEERRQIAERTLAVYRSVVYRTAVSAQT